MKNVMVPTNNIKKALIAMAKEARAGRMDLDDINKFADQVVEKIVRDSTEWGVWACRIKVTNPYGWGDTESDTIYHYFRHEDDNDRHNGLSACRKIVIGQQYNWPLETEARAPKRRRCVECRKRVQAMGWDRE